MLKSYYLSMIIVVVEKRGNIIVYLYIGINKN